MTVWPPLSDEEYAVVLRVLAEFDALEAKVGPLRNHPNPAMRTADEMRAQMQAAVEGYEATHEEEDR